MSNKEVVLITGAAGFIGSHLSRNLLSSGHVVVGVDCYTDYYDISIKKRRTRELLQDYPETFFFYELDLNEKEKLTKIFEEKKPEIVVHLAAQAGVGYCQQNPESAKRNNIDATEVLLSIVDREDMKITHFLYASSSSIYGCHQRPWSEELEPQPEGIYGNSKKLGEEMLKQRIGKKYDITSMRFFTVYGQAGRPDMAIQKFTELIHKGEKVPIFGDGTAVRDYTYVDDIVQGITLAMKNPRPYEAYNFGKGSDNPSSVIEVVRALETALNKKADIDFQPIRAGDVPATQANISKAQRLLGYNPAYSLHDGIQLSVPYFLQHYPKYPVLIIRSASLNLPLLRTQLSQQPRPSLVLAFDQQINNEVKDILDKSNIDHIYHAISENSNVFEHSYAILNNEILNSSRNDAHYTPSTTFLSFLDFESNSLSSKFSSPDWINLSVQRISKFGTEVVVDDSNSALLVRFDVLRNFVNNTGSDFSNQFFTSLIEYSDQPENNIRKSII